MKDKYLIGGILLLLVIVFFAVYYIWKNSAMRIVINIPTSTSTPVRNIFWGAYVGDGVTDLSRFEEMVGAEVDMLADFESWDASFPSKFKTNVGQQGKTLVVYWEPGFGYNSINDGSKDKYIEQFATDAAAYYYPVILAPFVEMNLNESDWGYGQNGNNAKKFIAAWKRVHKIFTDAGATNVKFALAFNNVSIPDVAGNKFNDYYPGDDYVDYVAVDGFNFGDPWQTPVQIFGSAISQLSNFKKPIYILSTASVIGTDKEAWIRDLGSFVRSSPNIVGWVWFNSNSDENWLVNTDKSSLEAFRSIVS